jgi:hypothetical protein
VGIAEIGKYAVAHIFGDEAAVFDNDLRATSMISVDDFPQILGIEPSRKCSGADEVAKHYRELATLSGILRLGCGRGCGLGRSRSSARKLGNRGLQLAPMTK